MRQIRSGSGWRGSVFALGALLLALLLPVIATAQEPAFSALAQGIRSDLNQAQLAMLTDAVRAQQQLDAAQHTYTEALGPALAAIAPAADARVQTAFAAAVQALTTGDTAAFAAARADVWTALLQGGYIATERALALGDGRTAQQWLMLREFRTATRFSRPNANATLAVAGLTAGQTSAADAQQALRADLLDTYQARLAEALHELAGAEQQGYATRRAEFAALADGYFAILAPAYAEQRGAEARGAAERAFAALRAAGVAGQPIKEAIAQVDQVLAGFRAAPLSAAEQTRRAGQMLRFLSLVPMEFARGVSGGQVTKDLEIREATTFRDGAAAAFTDLRTVLEARDIAKTQQIAQLFATLDQQLADTSTQQNVADPDVVEATSAQLTALLIDVMPPEWQRRDSIADFDVIQTALDQMEIAAAAGQYDLAESARLEAYAILESGPEAKLIVFAPQYKPVLEGLFWYGQDEQKGLAYLIEHNAPASEIKASRKALDIQLGAAQKALAGNNAPTAIATNAAVIVFREGLEAVLILASLMGSLKFGAQRALRKPLWLGAALAFVATALVWVLAQGLLSFLVRRGYHETLEAIVSLIAIAVLILITNWFFHDVYWKDWMANFHQQKKRMLTGKMSQSVGLATLGFASVFREGFETVLFLQALVLEAGLQTVLGGVAIGLASTLLIGIIVFVVQAKLPHKKMLIVTGMLIVLVLVQMVGNTVNILQVIGWLSLHPIRSLAPYMPYWAGMWFGLYATWEGILLQCAAGAFTVGSYFLAEYMHKRKQPKVGQASQPVPVQREHLT
jgi:high-affinity iron transporter